MLEMHAIVYGNVQCVGFRATARQIAEELKLSGFAKNLPDGTVEICAQGPKKDLEALLQKLRIHFDIDYVAVQFRSIENKVSGFRAC